MQLAQAYDQLGETELALAALADAARFSGGNSKTASLRGYMLAKAGRTAEAQAVLGQLDSVGNARAVERGRSESELKTMRDQEKRWERSTWIGGGACVLMFAFLLLLLRRDRTAAKAETQALRSELDSLRASVRSPSVGSKPSR